MTPSLGNYHNTVSQVADRLGQRIDKRTELKFLIATLENYPPLYRYSWDDPWNQHGSRIAQCRKDVGDIGDLAPRLLKLVLAQLRQYLITQDSRGYEIYRHGHHTYWTEKEAEFMKVAEEALASQPNSPRITVQVAEYLYSGVNRPSRGIEVLFVANRRGLLDDDGIATLADYLTRVNRHGEAAPLLEGLVDRQPRNMNYRTRLMTAYYHSQRPEQLRQTYNRTLADFQKEGQWTDDNIAAVAYACLTTGLNEEARQLFTDAVTRRQRSSATRGMGDESLSRWYQHLALANANLKRTADAVDAASSAIVCWPSTHHRRQEALETLKSVVQQSPDLDAYVIAVDAKVLETGQDSPLIRQAIGQAYRNRNQWDKAIVQFQAARELQPNNREINEALLACYDSLPDKAGAVRLLLEMLAIDRHNLALAKQLVERTKDDPAMAERAATFLIEAAPNEAEHHQALAEWREKQNRWSESLPHWERVAELRKLEPTGLLKLSAALIHEKQFGRAGDALKQVLGKDWPDRFANAHNEARDLLRQIPN